MVIEVPQCVAEEIRRLNEFCNAHPGKIPLVDLAEFLGTHPDSLRMAIEQNSRLFGYCWQKSINGNRAYYIPMLTFYNWYMNAGLEIRKEL